MLIHGEIIIIFLLLHIYILLFNIFIIIVIGKIQSIIYKTDNLWASGGIGRRVGLRNQ